VTASRTGIISWSLVLNLQGEVGSEFLAIIDTNLATFAYAWLRILFFWDKKLHDGVTGRRRFEGTFIVCFKGKYVLEELSFQHLMSFEGDNIILRQVDIRLFSIQPHIPTKANNHCAVQTGIKLWKAGILDKIKGVISQH
jgi:hypothetical protein